jgi:hypothetical protein
VARVGALSVASCLIAQINDMVLLAVDGFCVWYLKYLLAFITRIMHKLNKAAIFLECLMAFGITGCCETKFCVSSFRDIFEII